MSSAYPGSGHGDSRLSVSIPSNLQRFQLERADEYDVINVTRLHFPQCKQPNLCVLFLCEHVRVCSQERDPRQRLGGERPEGNPSVVSPERASLLGGRQQPLDLQLTAYMCCVYTVL